MTKNLATLGEGNVYAGRSPALAEEFDAVVVGAGLAGLQCARLLAGEGWRVLLADAKRDLAERVHTTGIFVRRTLEDFPLPPDCLGPAVRRVTLYSPARRAQVFESPHDEFRVGRMGRLYQRLLDECRAAGVEWWPSTRYAGCEPLAAESDEKAGRASFARAPRTRSSVRASRAGSSASAARTLVRLERGGLARLVSTRFLVGADGARSRVARDLKLDCNREWIVGVEEVYEGARTSGGEPQFHCFLDPRIAPGYLAWIVEDGEETHIGVGGYAERFDASRALAEFRAETAARFGLDRARFIERRGGRIPVGGVLRRIACARGLLVGDAAGAVSPLTAGGLDPALRLSALAARVASDYLATNDAGALALYSGARFRTRFRARLLMRRAASALGSPLLVEAACAALRVPPLDAFARQVFFGRGSFPDVGHATAGGLLDGRAAT